MEPVSDEWSIIPRVTENVRKVFHATQIAGSMQEPWKDNLKEIKQSFTEITFTQGATDWLYGRIGYFTSSILERGAPVWNRLHLARALEGLPSGP